MMSLMNSKGSGYGEDWILSALYVASSSGAAVVKLVTPCSVELSFHQ
jgi:hypothetical protein